LVLPRKNRLKEGGFFLVFKIRTFYWVYFLSIFSYSLDSGENPICLDQAQMAALLGEFIKKYELGDPNFNLIPMLPDNV